MRKFAADKIESIIKGMGLPVYAPVKCDELTVYDRYEDGMELNLGCCNTDKSPKDVLFPQWEDLMHFRMEGKTIQLTEQQRCNEDYVIFGMRACDIRAFEVLDKVFLADPVDTYYAARREHGILVAIACSEPDDTCFCVNFGIDPRAAQCRRGAVAQGRRLLRKGIHRQGRKADGELGHSGRR